VALAEEEEEEAVDSEHGVSGEDEMS